MKYTNYSSVFVALAVFFFATLSGCVTEYSDGARGYDELAFLKRIEKETINDFPILWEVLKQCQASDPPQSDPFQFGVLRDCYLMGRSSHALYGAITGIDSESAPAETNWCTYVFHEGLQDAWVEHQQGDSYKTGLASVGQREQARLLGGQRFWTRIRHSDEDADHVRRELAHLAKMCRLNDEALTLIASNRYESAWSGYSNGYQNARLVLQLRGKSPIATSVTICMRNIVCMPLEWKDRAYVYGWYAACLDFFSERRTRAVSHDDTSAYLYYKYLLDQVLRDEEEYRRSFYLRDGKKTGWKWRPVSDTGRHSCRTRRYGLF